MFITGNSKLQSDFQSNTFFEKLKDWFDNLRTQIHERLFGPSVTTSPPLSTEILNLDRSSLQKRFRNHEWHLLDLCKYQSLFATKITLFRKHYSEYQ